MEKHNNEKAAATLPDKCVSAMDEYQLSVQFQMFFPGTCKVTIKKGIIIASFDIMAQSACLSNKL